MQLEKAKILRRGRIRRAAEKGCKCPDVPDIVVARLLDEVAHRHVFDHAPAQRADGFITHRGAPVLRWRLLEPLDSQDRTPGLSSSPAYFVTPSVPLAPLRAQRVPAKRVRSLVESRCGAVALGRTYLLPPLSSGGALVVQPWLRFHIPLIEPDWQISRIRLSDKTSRLRFRVQRHLQLLNIYRS